MQRLSLLVLASLLGCEGGADPSVLVAQGGQAPQPQAPDYQAAFPDDRVVEVTLMIGREDWRAMSEEMATLAGEFGSGALPAPGPTGELLSGSPSYVRAALSTGDATFADVEVRFKGNSSLVFPWVGGVMKLPLRLRFGKESGQLYYGFANLTLANNWNDPSLLRESMGSEVFARVGTPTPRTAFYAVSIDHGDGVEYFGLYTAVELPKETPFLERNFGGAESVVYKPEGPAATWQVWDPGGLGAEGDTDYQDAKRLFDALHSGAPGDEAYREGVERALDLAGFSRWLATNTALADWDQYGKMAHNYYLVSDPVSDRLVWIPWDHNASFHGPGLKAPLELNLTGATEGWPLLELVRTDPVAYSGYLEDLAVAADTLRSPEVRELIEERHNLIAPYVVGAQAERPGFSFVDSPEAFALETDELLGFLVSQPAAIDELLAAP